jgi:cytochrome c556
MAIYLKLAGAFLVAVASSSFFPQEPTKPKQDQDDAIVIPADDTGAMSRRDFMRTKLLYSQNIFEGLTTGNFDAIEKAIEEVQSITSAEQWVAIDNAKYRQLTEEFKTSTKRLKEAAKTKNLDATALRFYNLSTSCIDCHNHIRQARYEF